MLKAKRNACLVLILTVFSVAPLCAQQPAPAASVPQTLHLLVNRTVIITSPVRIVRLSIANPDIADPDVISPYQVLINGKSPGAVTMILWGANGETETFDLYVDVDVVALSQKIHEVFPSEHVQIEASKNVVMLTGQASSADVADEIVSLVKAEVPNVITMIQVPTPPAEGQILLAVKFAELDLSKAQQFGFNVFTLPTGIAKTLGVIQTQQFGAVSVPSVTGSATNVSLASILNLFVFRPDIGMGITLAALQSSSILQILAEPSLLTETGKKASFLAGGEFPFPVVQGGGAGSVPTVSIQFKQFGVILEFTPTLTADGKIDLIVSPEVSTLDFSNALEFQGFLIPAISTRRAESEMLLKDGETFAIAGLLDRRVTKVLDKVPWISSLPILGKLFTSNSLQTSRDELLVLVTPHIVKPYAPGKEPPVPQYPLRFMTWPPPSSKSGQGKQ